MDWFTKILKGSSRKRRCRCHEKHDDEDTWDQARNSGSSSDFDTEEARSIAEEDEEGKRVIDEQIANQLEEEDEELAQAIQESWNVNSPPRSPRHRICAGCNSEIEHEGYLSRMKAVWHPECFRCHSCDRPISGSEEALSRMGAVWHPECFRCHSCGRLISESKEALRCMGAVWHPECFRCYSCDRPISESKFFASDNGPCHISCVKCYVCNNSIPTNADGRIQCIKHPLWPLMYCPSHKDDGIPLCYSCERMEPEETTYLILEDGRRLCFECLESSIMDTRECQQLHLEIQEFYEGLNMKVEQQIPLHLVKREVLTEAMESEKNGHHHTPETRGFCLYDLQIVSMILERIKTPIIEGHGIIKMVMEGYRVDRKCEITAILVLYGLPRLLTGSILAHEMMHAWLKLTGYPTLSGNVEEGICQVLAHKWLDAEISAGSATTNKASTSNSTTSFSKKGKLSEFEKKLGEFFIHLIESDRTPTYGDGFRKGNEAVNNYGLKRTLDHIRLKGCFP